MMLLLLFGSFFLLLALGVPILFSHGRVRRRLLCGQRAIP